MTSYQTEDLSGWEFKILRSRTSAFGKPEKLREALTEEARAGWVLVEKFDDARIRMKRPVAAQKNDDTLGFDPYRTFAGMPAGQYGLMVAAITIGIVLLVIICGVAIAILLQPPGPPLPPPPKAAKAPRHAAHIDANQSAAVGDFETASDLVRSSAFRRLPSPALYWRRIPPKVRQLAGASLWMSGTGIKWGRTIALSPWPQVKLAGSALVYGTHPKVWSRRSAAMALATRSGVLCDVCVIPLRRVCLYGPSPLGPLDVFSGA